MIIESLINQHNAMWASRGSPFSTSAATPTPSTSLRQAASEGSSLLGKRDSDGAPRRRQGTNRSGSRYRGVTHHARTNRYEAHLWDEGKQLYLGGFYNEEQAALAYDLAAIRFRGDEASTNFAIETYREELAARHEVTREQLVACLRDQSKAMNKVEAGAGAGAGAGRMEPWELALSAALHTDIVHLGVYGTELEAARSYDRALVAAQGIEAAQMLNFPLVDYIDLLGNEHRAAGMERGLLPATLPLSYMPSAVPQSVATVALPTLAMMGYLSALSSPEEGTTPEHTSQPGTGAATNGATSQQVARRKSITPRSVLDFDDYHRQHPREQNKAGGGAIDISNERNAIEQQLGEFDDMQNWVNALTL